MAFSARRADGLRLERMQASRQYAGGGFANTYPSSVQRVPEGRTPANPHPIIDPRASWARPVETGLRATWLGHSTVLLEIDGHRVLTDPVWGARVSPLPFLGPKRFHPVPVDIASLPLLDAVLISHDHYDHLDYPSIRALAKLRVPFVTSLGVGLLDKPPHTNITCFGCPISTKCLSRRALGEGSRP